MRVHVRKFASIILWDSSVHLAIASYCSYPIKSSWVSNDQQNMETVRSDNSPSQTLKGSSLCLMWPGNDVHSNNNFISFYIISYKQIHCSCVLSNNFSWFMIYQLSWGWCLNIIWHVRLGNYVRRKITIKPDIPMHIILLRHIFFQQ